MRITGCGYKAVTLRNSFTQRYLNIELLRKYNSGDFHLNLPFLRNYHAQRTRQRSTSGEKSGTMGGLVHFTEENARCRP